MGFIERIKEQIIDPRMGNHQRKERVIVNACDLRELMGHFERIDSEMRSLDHHPSVHETLSRAIEAEFHHNGKDGEVSLLVIMDTLKPLIEERHKQKLIERRI
jgi:hypothetical protein